jgi:4'-phosphopantetheinyl transferase
MQLSAAERERADKFYFDEDRARFMLAHGALRQILSRYLGLGPGEIVFDQGPQGKPNLDPMPDRKGLTFNLSHSGSFVLIAVGRERELGVDVEKVRPEIDLEGIAGRFFSEAEQEALLSLAPQLRPAAFFRCWTRKEAYIKARGGGLSIPLGQFDVTLDPESEAALLATRDDPAEADRWSLYNLEVGEGYQAALAVAGQGVGIRIWDWEGVD